MARARLRAAPIWLLDEPTTNLDPVTERDLLRSMLEVTSGSSLLLITHRLVAMEAFDEILVLSEGRLVQGGRHADLVGAAGPYQRLWALQNRSQVTEPVIDELQAGTAGNF